MEERSLLPVEEQLKVITSGTMQIVPLEELKKKLEKGTPLNIKLGVDPTSPDLHLGHAVPLRKMRQFQDLGHNVTLIIGNGTALIGDPSGRDSTRPPLTEEQVEANAKTYVEQAMKVLDPEKTQIVHNGDWLKGLNLAEMLKLMSQRRDAQAHEPVQRGPHPRARGLPQPLHRGQVHRPARVHLPGAAGLRLRGDQGRP